MLSLDFWILIHFDHEVIKISFSKKTLDKSRHFFFGKSLWANTRNMENYANESAYL